MNLSVASSNPGLESGPRIEVDYGPAERRLGVSVNRDLAKALGRTDYVFHNDSAGTIMIDIERDPFLQEFLGKIKAEASGKDILTYIASALKRVVSLTPHIDEDDSYHFRRRVTLGEALLQQPVLCIDRALAFEAVVKMAGIADARLLISQYRHPLTEALEESHADIVLMHNSTRFMGITMGERAGDLVGEAEYLDHLRNREELFSTKIQLQESWGRAYFESVPPS